MARPDPPRVHLLKKEALDWATLLVIHKSQQRPAWTAIDGEPAHMQGWCELRSAMADPDHP